MNITIATVLGLAATLLAFACTVPQLAKLMRGRSAAGISVAALANSTISGIAWTVFGLAEGEVWVALPALVALPATAGAMVLAWRDGGSRARMWLPVVWLTVILTATALVPLAGMVPITVVLGCSVALLITPAAITAWRSHDVSGIAASGWVILVFDALLCGAYGVIAGVDANVLYAITATVGAVAILTRISLPAHVHARIVPLPAGIDPNVHREDLSLAA
ncbi:PQ-loop repeat-containing protein [Nocardioides sp. SR21]|uniref:PQ-loop repeat-containing protein n=1 Tax=Nocardioides sp. SR21 TaxID=2919501 RepID=UPI001FA9E503|nr:PQ-loop repeat-containing protein [Nocardioides sp. SR21]